MGLLELINKDEHRCLRGMNQVSLDSVRMGLCHLVSSIVSLLSLSCVSLVWQSEIKTSPAQSPLGDMLNCFELST